MQNPESAVRVLRCQIDDQPWTVCTSPKSYGGLLAGDHVLRVTAVEDGLWDQTPAERTFTIASEPSPDLVPIDGGPGYYGQFSNPLPTDPSYFPIGVWLESVLSQADVDEDKAAGLNLYVLLTANSNLALVRGNGMRSIIQSGERTRFTDIGAETAAWELYDEIDMQQGPNGGYTTLENILNGLPQDGRARYNNYGKGVLFWETDAEAARFINEFQHVQSADGYFFTDPFICGPSEGGGVPEVVKTDGCRVAANYGWIVDRTRYLDGLDGQRKPVWAFVEVGWPFSESAAQGGRAIAPPEIRAAVWQSIIAGARGIIYFNHSFGGPCPAQHALRDPCYAAQRAMVTSVNAQVTQLAPVLNAPFDVSFADASPSVRAMTKYHNGTYYVFAGSRENRPSTATFFVRSGSQAVVEGEGRIIPITNGRFSDDFADGNAIHIYRIE